MKDMHSGLKVSSLLAPAVYAADSTPVGVDRLGYEGAEIVLNIAAGGITFSGTNKIEFVLTHSDDDTTYTNVADADMLGVSGISSGIIKTLNAAHASAAAYRFGYVGNKRYLKLLADFSGTHGTGTGLAASVVLGQASLEPVAAQA